MKFVAVFAALVGLSCAAHAQIPSLNATCPGSIEVHADEGGPIYINGEEAKLKTFNDSAYEARQGQVAISLTINPDGSPAVSYTGPNRANGICTVAVSGAAAAEALDCPPDVSEADRYKYPACN